MTPMAWPFRTRRERFSQIMGQCGKSNERIPWCQLCCHITDKLLMQTGIDLWVIGCALRNAVEVFKFW